MESKVKRIWNSIYNGYLTMIKGWCLNKNLLRKDGENLCYYSLKNTRLLGDDGGESKIKIRRSI